MLSNGDIMGGVNDVLETMNSGVAMFINADAGDIAPCEYTQMCTEILMTVQLEYFNAPTVG